MNTLIKALSEPISKLTELHGSDFDVSDSSFSEGKAHKEITRQINEILK
jgi:hypothetical protein